MHIRFTFYIYSNNIMTQQTFCHRKILFAAVSLQQHFWPECLINFCHYTTFTVKRNSPSVLVRATAEGRNIDLNVLWSLVHEKTEVLPHIDKRILTHCCSQCCKLTHTHTHTHTLSYSQSCRMTRELFISSGYHRWVSRISEMMLLAFLSA